MSDPSILSAQLNAPSHALQKSFQILTWSTSVYRGLNEFFSFLKPLYFSALGLPLHTIFKVQGLHLLSLALLDAPLAVYADRFSRKQVLILGCLSQFIAVFMALTLSFSSQSSPSFILTMIYASDFLYAFGRSIAGSSLDTMAVAHFSNRDLPPRYHYRQYIYLVQRSSLLLKVLAVFSALFLSHFSYRLSFLGCTVGYGLLYGLLLQLPSHQKAQQSKANQSVWGSLVEQIGSAGRALFQKPWGMAALFSGALLCFLRQALHQNWQIALFHQKISLKDHLPPELMIPFASVYLGIAVSGTFLNERLKRSTSRWFMRGCLAFAALSSLILTQAHTETFLGQISIPAFCCAYSLLDIAIIRNHRLFADSVDKRAIASINMLLHAFGRFFSFLIFRAAVQPFPFFHGPAIFYLTASAFLMLSPLFCFWGSRIRPSIRT